MSHLTIGVPVYNHAQWLGATLDSLLAQTYDDLRIVIADNASTDGTQDIGRDYAAREQRVSYVRRDRNVGASENFNDLARRATTPFFKWAASDDLCAPTYVERCLRALQDHPEAIGAYSRTRRIDADGVPFKDEVAWLRCDSSKPHVRLRNVISKPHSSFPVYGVYRTEALQRTRLFRTQQGSDMTLLSELALVGPIIEIPEYLLLRRVHAASYSLGATSGDSHNSRFWLGKDDAPEAQPPSRWARRPIFHEVVAVSDLDNEERGRCHTEIEVSFRLGQVVKDAIAFTSPARRAVRERLLA